MKEYTINLQRVIINLIESMHVDLIREPGMEKFKSFNKKSIIDGYEGIMIKDPKSYYECKRSTTWWKVKTFIEIFEVRIMKKERKK